MAIVVIDPGHGGQDAGAVSGGYQEKNFTLSIGLKVRDYLQKNYEVDVLMTRTGDQTVSLSQRTNFANSRNADYFCSIHINAGGGTGWESFIFNGSVPQATIRQQEVIHNTVMNVIESTYGVRDRGKKRANFHVLRETQMSAVLLENLFIDTARDLDLLRNETFIQDLAAGIGKGIGSALDLPVKNQVIYRVIAGSFQEESNAENRKQFLQENQFDAMVVTATIDGQMWYRVQAGAFRDQQNAENLLEEIKKLGIDDAFVLKS